MGLLDNLAYKIGSMRGSLARGYEEARKAQGSRSDDDWPDWMLGQAKQDKYNLPDLSLYENQAKLYRALSWISTAIDITAQTAASAKFSVKQRTGEDEKDIPNHEFELLLEQPNDEHGQFEFWQTFFSWYKLTGNGYLWLNRSGPDAPPAEVWVIPSNRIKPVPDEHMWLKGYTYDTGGGGTLPLETWEVLHLKNFNPFTKYVGLSALESLNMVAGGDLSQQKYTVSLYGKDNAKIPGALAFADNIADPEWEKLKEDAKANWGGTRQAGPMFLRGVGAGGVQWLTMALSQKQMEFIAQRQFSKEEIWSKVAPGLASILDPNATEANALSGKAVFIEYNVWPMLVAAAQKVTHTILKTYGDNLVGSFDDIRVANRLLDQQEQQEYSKTHTIAEIRHEYYGDDPLGDGRDTLLPAEIGSAKSVSAQPADNNGNTGEPDPGVPPVASAEVQTELKAWENFALKRLGKMPTRDFEPRAIPLLQAARIKAALKSAVTSADVRNVFAAERDGGDDELKRANDLLEKALAIL